MPVNESNFLMWFDPGESQFSTKLPRAFVREPDQLSPVVWLVPGETYSFWVNTISNTAMMEDAEITNPVTGAVFSLNSGAVKQVQWGGGAHRICTFVTPNLPTGYYKLRIGSRTSQLVYLTTLAHANTCTAILKFRDTGRIMSFRWSHAPVDFYQCLRVRMSVRGFDPEVNKKVYTGSYTGKTRQLNSTLRKMVTITTPEYDENGHDAWVRMMEHETIFINGNPYAFGSAYKPNVKEDDPLSTGECSLSDEFYAGLHRG